MPTRSELLDEAAERGIDVDPKATKAELAALLADSTDEVESSSVEEDAPAEIAETASVSVVEDAPAAQKCANCTSDAAYVTVSRTAAPLHFCGRCKPRGEEVASI